MTLTHETVARAVPALLRGRVLAAVEAAQNAAGGPATAAQCHQASTAGGLAPVGRDPRGFTTAARRVLGAQRGPDADGLELHRAGVNRIGAVVWWVSRVEEPSPATAVRISEQLARLGLARADEAPLRTVARLLGEAPAPAGELAPAPSVAPPRNEPAPLAQAPLELAPETAVEPDTFPPTATGLHSDAIAIEAPPARDWAPAPPPVAPPPALDLASAAATVPDEWAAFWSTPTGGQP